jgi:hypothetical protein
VHVCGPTHEQLFLIMRLWKQREHFDTHVYECV